MANVSSPQSGERLKRICREVCVAQQLDDSIERELYAHLEDKLLGYLSGGEKITEDDALLLVEKRFGDPVVVRSLLGEVHGASRATQAGWHRRLAAIMIATSLFDAAASALLFLGRGIIAYF